MNPEPLDITVLTAEQLHEIDIMANLLDDEYTHAFGIPAETDGDEFEILHLVDDIRLVEFITDPQYRLVSLSKPHTYEN